MCFFFTDKKKSHPVSIVYVPSHLYHMLFELFKVRESSQDDQIRMTGL